MADNTIIQQGSFTSDGNSIIISLRSDVDWMQVYNLTELAAANNVGVQFYWQREFIAAGVDGLRYSKTGGLDTLQVLTMANDEFQLIDSSTQDPLAAVAVTSTTNANPVVVATGSTTGLATGTIVRLNTIANRNNLSGFDFEIDTVIANTSFENRWALANVPGGAGGAGFYRVIPFDPIYYPRRRFIVNITQAAQAVIRFSVTHGYTIGQEIRFTVPTPFDMVELDGIVGTITAISTANNTVTVNVDTTAFTAFAFPVAGDFPFNWAQAVPLGIDTAQALTSAVDILADATENLAILGMQLRGAQDNPGGANGDVITWVAGKSFNTGL